MSKRLDHYLVDHGMVKTRSQAKMLIIQGDVIVNGSPQKKASYAPKENDQITIKRGYLYVSRGAYKLKEALDLFKVDVAGKTILDAGASTGGFTQVLLEYGAKKVYAVDVGKDQLASLLMGDPRVVEMNGVNLRDPLDIDDLDFFVMDVSFISSKLILPSLLSMMGDRLQGVVLFKPQFECGKDRLSKGGIVSAENRLQTLSEYKEWLRDNNYTLLGECESPIRGKDGNTEYLLYLGR